MSGVESGSANRGAGIVLREEPGGFLLIAASLREKGVGVQGGEKRKSDETVAGVTGV